MILEFKILRHMMQPEIRITGLYMVIHIFSKIILLLFFWTLEVGKGRLNPKKAYHRRIPNLEIVTVHRRSDSKRAYRPQVFFLKLSLTAMIKWIKNMSRQKTYDLSTGYTLNPWFSCRNTSLRLIESGRTVPWFILLPLEKYIVRLRMSLFLWFTIWQALAPECEGIQYGYCLKIRERIISGCQYTVYCDQIPMNMHSQTHY